MLTVPADGTITTADFNLGKGAVLAGTVTSVSSGEPVEGAQVCAYDPEGASICPSTDADGKYEIRVAQPGDFVLSFTSPYGSAYLTEYYNDSTTQEGAQKVTLSATQIDSGARVENLDAALTRTPYTIEGRVTGPDGAPVPRLEVQAGYYYRSYTNSRGRYAIKVEPGQHVVAFGPNGAGEFISEYYDNASSWSTGKTITVGTAPPGTPAPVEDHVTGIDATLAIGGAVRGKVSNADTGTGTGIGSATVAVQPLAGSYPTRSTTTASDGTYRIPGLPTGQYRVYVSYYQSGFYQTLYRYFDNSTTYGGATPADVTAEETKSGIDFGLHLRKPLAPTAVTAEPASRAVRLTWPKADGLGNPIQRYEVSLTPGYTRSVYDTETLTVEGLTNDTEYTAAVRALTDIGWSDWTTPVTFTPAARAVWTAPPVSTRDDRSIRVRWTLPTTDGTPLTGFTARAYDAAGNPAGWEVTAGAEDTSATVSGLTNGVPYAVVVTARNAYGGTPSEPSNTVAPAGKPLAPAPLTASVGDKSLSVNWAAAPDNGAVITGYSIVTKASGKADRVITVGADDRSADLTGLVNGTSYVVTVAGINEVGTGVAAQAPAVVPAGLPLAMTAPTVEPRDSAILVAWDAANGNGRPVLEYRVRLADGTERLIGSDALEVIVDGLANGSAHTATIAARNELGWGRTLTSPPP